MKRWNFYIFDMTHSCFSRKSVIYSDWNIEYTYTSYRKWVDVLGLAIANKVDSDFSLPYQEKCNME